MTPLIITSTQKTPDVNFDSNSGVFSIKGMSCAEYAMDFYKPVLEWLDQYAKNPKSKTVINIQYKYFNTSSAKCILQFLERIVMLKSNGIEVQVNWFYDKGDEQMLQDGENYSEILELPFNILEKS